MIRLRALLCLAAAVGVVTSCSVSALSVNDSQFRAVWSPGWTRVNAAAKPLVASATDPGACNIGGGERACVRTSQNMIAALSKLETELAAVATPHEYGAASATIQHAVDMDIKGLTDRINAIKAKDNSLFSRGINELQQAARLFVQGYAEFPPETRPTPQPFNGAMPG